VSTKPALRAVDHGGVAFVEHAHLAALAEEMLKQGNSWTTPFQPSQGGWWGQLSGALDPVICTRAERECASISYDPGEDSLWCRHCWAVIFGGNHTFRSAALGV
jgi:hypothetical protein